MTTTPQEVFELIEKTLVSVGKPYIPSDDTEANLRAVIATYTGKMFSPSMLTEMMAHTADMLEKQGKILDYHGQDVEPGDELYMDALADHQHDIELVVLGLIQQQMK